MDLAEGIGKRLAQAAIAAVVDGKVTDLTLPLPEGADLKIKLLTDRDPEALEVLRHSCAHIMARAVLRLFPAGIRSRSRERLLLRHRIPHSDPRGGFPAHRGGDAQDHQGLRAV